MIATSPARQAGSWTAFGVVAAVAVYFFGFIALAVLCLVLAVALARAATTTRGWIRVALWVAALAIVALPALLYVEAAAGVTTLRIT